MDLTFSCVKDLENLSFSLSSTMGTLYYNNIHYISLVVVIRSQKKKSEKENLIKERGRKRKVSL